MEMLADKPSRLWLTGFDQVSVAPAPARATPYPREAPGRQGVTLRSAANWATWLGGHFDRQVGGDKCELVHGDKEEYIRGYKVGFVGGAALALLLNGKLESVLGLEPHGEFGQVRARLPADAREAPRERQPVVRRQVRRLERAFDRALRQRVPAVGVDGPPAADRFVHVHGAGECRSLRLRGRHAMPGLRLRCPETRG